MERQTGLLHVTRGEERGSVCFVQGNIVYGESNVKECHLGETLVRHGLLTEWDLERAREMMKVTGRRLGQVLVDLGVLDANGREEALAIHVREVLLTIFSWREGTYRFDEHDASSFRGYDGPLPLSMGEVILDAVWSITEPDVIRFGLGNLDRVLVPASDPILRFQRITLNETDGFLLSRIDGGSTAAQILRMAPVSAEEARRSLFGLVCTGMVEWLGEKPAAAALPERRSVRNQILDAHARLEGQGHHEVLGIPEGASPREIQAAFVRLAKLYHPDAHHAPELHDLKDKLEALFWRVTEALHALTRGPDRPSAHGSAATPSTPAAPSLAAPKVETPPAAEPAAGTRSVEDSLDHASERLGAGHYWEVLVAVDQALPQVQGRLRRRARMLKAQALLQSPKGRRAAEEELKAALEEDRGNADAHFLLGTIYRDGGANALAAASFKRVLALRPRHSGAVEALASLDSGDPERARPSGLRGLFKRS